MLKIISFLLFKLSLIKILWVFGPEMWLSGETHALHVKPELDPQY